MRIHELMEAAASNDASDLHISVGLPPIIRVSMGLRPLNDIKVTPDMAQQFARELMNNAQWETFMQNGEFDFSLSIPGKYRYRINVFRQRQSIALAMRLIKYNPPDINTLGLPPIVPSLCGLNRGLILVTGPTGSGKSTTLAAMIDLINNTRSRHILTLEDPIEYLHRHKKCIVNQREIGVDSADYSKALRAALRQDPDIILIGEMRDLETISIALTAAETGHLVLSTLHTTGAAQTIDRIIDVFPPHQQQQVRMQVSLTLMGVISQQLVMCTDGKTRVAAVEVMVATSAIRNLIRENKAHQIAASMQASITSGNLLMDNSLASLYKSGRITRELALTPLRGSELYTDIALIIICGVITIKYLYKAANKAGQTVEGLIEASDKKAVVFALRAKSLYLLSLSEVNPKTTLEIAFGSAKLPKRTLAVFCTQFASILKAGVPLIQALTILEEQTENAKLKKILQAVGEDLQRGKGLSEAMSVHERALPTMMIKMIEAGELSGTLDLSLERLAVHFEKEYNISKKIRGAMMYPIIVSIVAVLVIVFMLLFVIPRFMTFFQSSGTELPAITKFMLSLSNFISTNWMYILAVGLMIFVAFKLYKSSPSGRLTLDTIKLKMPVFKKSVTRILAARFSRTLATLTATGISLTQSLRIASKVVGNRLAENKLIDIEESIKQGKSLNVSIANAAIFPGMMVHMSKIGEESGTLDQMLGKAADYFEEEADVAITRLTAILQPVLLVIVAVLILFVMLSVLMPMLTMYSNMK